MEKILLVEPEYKNKFPPIGLMKIATYHRNKGDHVEFYKGEAPYSQIIKKNRVYITSLFTFDYDITLRCISHYAKFFDHDSIFVGGIAATLMTKDFEKETNIKNIIRGQLFSSKTIGYDDDVNIDALPLNYDILDDIIYKYPAKDNYFVYTTRGCPRRCKFCAVRILEPEFKTTNNVIDQVKRVDEVYGKKRNLLVMDNNILCSPKLPEIIDDICSLGFTVDEWFIPPNQLQQMINKLKRRKQYHLNISRQVSETLEILNNFSVRIRNYSKVYDGYIEIMREIQQSSDSFMALEKHSDYLINVFEKYRAKTKMVRYVDFNQGIDARLINKVNMTTLSKISIRPFRLAYDNVADSEIFIKSTKLAFENKIRQFSNYMLYNWEDRPEELWIRLHKAICLYSEFGEGVHGFSFPMKYAPIDEKDRSYIGKYWNKKYLNAINVIINVTNGVVAQEKDFFYEAFGSNIDEYIEILNMPDEFIRYRFEFKENGLLDYWKTLFRSLSKKDKKYLLEVLCNPDFNSEVLNNHPISIKKILPLYNLKKSQFDKGEKSYKIVVSEIESLS